MTGEAVYMGYTWDSGLRRWLRRGGGVVGVGVGENGSSFNP